MMPLVTTRERRADRGRQRGMRIGADLGRAFRNARRSLGLSQLRVAELVGLSQATISRLENGRSSIGIVTLAMIADVLGLDLVVTLHPGGAPVRDAGHIRVMTRLRSLLPAQFVLKTEVPVPIMGDRRAIDVLIADPRLDTGFELETRLTDAQALVRRIILKQRDTGLACMGSRLPRYDREPSGGGGCLTDAAAELPAQLTRHPVRAARRDDPRRERDSLRLML